MDCQRWETSMSDIDLSENSQCHDSTLQPFHAYIGLWHFQGKDHLEKTRRTSCCGPRSRSVFTIVFGGPWNKLCGCVRGLAAKPRNLRFLPRKPLDVKMEIAKQKRRLHSQSFQAKYGKKKRPVNRHELTTLATFQSRQQCRHYQYQA